MSHHEKEAFLELLCSLEVNYANSPWCQAQGIEGWLRSLENEVAELRASITMPPSLCPACISLRKAQPIQFEHSSHHVSCGAFGFQPPSLRLVGGEIGDVFWNLLSLTIAFWQIGGAPLATILRNADEKLHRRKPWIFDPDLPQPKTADEEHAFYTAHKQRLAETGHD